MNRQNIIYFSQAQGAVQKRKVWKFLRKQGVWHSQEYR